MKNLKVSFYLDKNTPVLLNRFTTLDSILLSAYYGYLAKNGKRLEFDKDHKTVEFIHKEKGVFSGSIWYIDRTENIYLDFHKIVKKPEYRDIFDATGKKASTDVLYKAAIIEEEMMLVEKIHFYIRGKKEHIEALLNIEVSHIGKKQRLGFGLVSKVIVEEIKEDKGFMLNESTASKPLPVSDFDVKSKKIAFFRKMPPYWEQDGREACYMPTSTLYEYTDNTNNKQYTVAKNLDYITNIEFVYQTVKKWQGKDFREFEMNTIPKKKEYFTYKSNGEAEKCAFTGEIKNDGVYFDIKNFMSKWKNSFGDYDLIKNYNFISKEALWVIDNIFELGYTLISEGDREYKYLQSKKANEDEKINHYMLNHTMFKPPFSINLKSTTNAQHVAIRSVVSVSNAFYYLQYGKKTLQIDVQLLNEALEDIKRITSEYKNISKTHLCGNFKDNSSHLVVKKSDDKLKHEIIIQEFHKKYNTDLRNYLNVVAS